MRRIPLAPFWSLVFWTLGADPTLAAAPGAGLDGSKLGFVWALPFIGLLLSIALLPLWAPRFWHHHYGKVSAFWSLAVVLPLLAVLGLAETTHQLVHVALLEYLPFIILLTALFTVAGGVRLLGRLHGTPVVNTAMLATGTLIASVMGTTGAAMLLVRPMIRANRARPHNQHVFVFLIFLVANIGGSLSPLGDPPLFLGFLKGVPFFWPAANLLAEMLTVAGVLLVVFYLIDRHFYRREPRPQHGGLAEVERLDVVGRVNLVLLACAIGAVLLTGIWRPAIAVTVHGVAVGLEQIATSVLLIVITLLSLVLTPGEHRAGNDFSWGPMIEVGKLFAAIFVTIVPVIAILRAGSAGAMGGLVDLVMPGGQPNNAMFFWLSGGLSSFLDNAPTYLVFFNIAGGDPAVLTTSLNATLTAIAAGSVFMGANTYIGNAPNFMVKAVCEEQGVAMPSFFGYMAWSAVLLLPCFALVTVLFFR